MKLSLAFYGRVLLAATMISRLAAPAEAVQPNEPAAVFFISSLDELTTDVSYLAKAAEVDKTSKRAAAVIAAYTSDFGPTFLNGQAALTLLVGNLQPVGAAPGSTTRGPKADSTMKGALPCVPTATVYTRTSKVLARIATWELGLDGLVVRMPASGSRKFCTAKMLSL